MPVDLPPAACLCIVYAVRSSDHPLARNSGSIATIAQGDPVTISGIATGHPQVGLQIWFIGYNFAKVTTVQVNNDNTYEYQISEVPILPTLRPDSTLSLSSTL